MSPDRSSRRGWIALGALLVSIVTAHLVLIRATDETRFIGDELGYLEWAPADVARGTLGLLPGQLRFTHRSPLASRVFAQLARGDGVGEQTLFWRVRLFHVALLAGLLACLYAQGRLLGLGPIGALWAPLLLACFPWFGFFVHSLFADVLRTTLLYAALTGLLLQLSRPRPWTLIPTGLLAGYAILARDALMHFFAAACVLLAATTWWRAAGRPRGARARRSAAAAALFGGSALLVVGPQLFVNQRDGHGLRLATTTWRNLEIGLRGSAPSDPPELAGYTWRAASRDYVRGDPTLLGREREARRRTLRFLASLPPWTHARRQTEKLAHLVTRQYSLFEHSVRNGRWGDAASERLRGLLAPARGYWYALLALGVAGIPVLGWRSPGWALVALLASWFIGGLWLVGHSMRLAMPLVPALCLLAGGTLVTAARYLGRRPRPGAAAQTGASRLATS